MMFNGGRVQYFANLIISLGKKRKKGEGKRGSDCSTVKNKKRAVVQNYKPLQFLNGNSVWEKGVG